MSTNTVETPEQPSSNDNQLEIIRSAPLEDILFDQLAWLIAHSKAQNMECPEECGDCTRLQMVTDLLMAPFYESAERAER